MLTPIKPASAGRRLNAGSLIALGLAALTMGLGFWQWQRGLEKQAILQAVEAQNRQAQILSLGQDLPWQLGRPATDLDRKVFDLKGQWLPESTVYLDNRLLNGRPGVHILTALLLPDQSLVWVNRGWAAKPPGLEHDRARELIKGGPHRPTNQPVLIRAVGLSTDLQRLQLSRQADDLRQGALWQNFDWAAAAGLVAASSQAKTIQPERVWPAIFWQTSDSSDGLVRQVPKPPDDAVDKHRGYALQWWLMAVAALVFAWRLSRPQSKA